MQLYWKASLVFRDDLLSQNSYHAVNKINEFYVAPMLTPPKFAWFRDNGPKPRFYNNRLGEMLKLNACIKEFNTNNNFSGVLPNFQTWDYEVERSVDVSEERVFPELFCSSVCHKHHLEGGVE